MIGYLSGKLFLREDQSVVILAGGIGYRVYLLERTDNHVVGSDISVHIFTYSRDGLPELYGFDEYDDRILFERLISVSGVGPKSALAILCLAKAKELQSAIAAGDSALLKKVSGIGNKTAERIVVELKNVCAGSMHAGSYTSGTDDIVDALLRLGYSRPQAQTAVQSIPPSVKSEEEKVRYALKNLSL